MGATFSIDAPSTAEFDAVVDRVTALEIAAPGGGGSPASDIDHFDLFCHPSYPALGQPTNDWLFPGNALSASLRRFRFDWCRPIADARWMVVWDPNTSGTQTGIRLVQSDDGPTNLVELDRFVVTGPMSPITGAKDVTAKLQALQQAGVMKNIGHQTIGNGSAGPKIYRSTLEIRWG